MIASLGISIRGSISSAFVRQAASIASEVIDGQFYPLPGSQTAQFEASEPDALEFQDRAALAGEHPADLVVAALGQLDVGLARTDPAQGGGRARLCLAGKDKFPT